MRALYYSREHPDGNGPRLIVTLVQLPPSELRFVPTDDAVVKRGSLMPTKASPRIKAVFIDSDRDFTALLRFEVSGVGDRAVSSAVLRLHASKKKSDHGGMFSAVRGAIWDEDTIGYDSAPTTDIVLGSLGPVQPDSWYEVNATDAVTGDGSVTFRISPGSSKRAFYDSREGDNPPELVITLL